MNTKTNEIIDLSEMDKQETEKKFEDGFIPVPENLSRAARRKLGKYKSAQVSFTSGGKLSQWAAQVRKNQKNDI